MRPPTCLAFKSRTPPTKACLFWLKMYESKDLVKHGGAVVQGSFHLLSVMCLDLRQDVVDCQAAVATICVLRRRPVLEVGMVWLHSSTSHFPLLSGAEERAAASFAPTFLPSKRQFLSTFLHGSNEGCVPTQQWQGVSAELRENLILNLILLTYCWVAMPFIILLEKWSRIIF